MPRYFLFQMTGLDIEKDQVIEMACIVTDSDLNIIAEVGFFCPLHKQHKSHAVGIRVSFKGDPHISVHL